MGGMFQKYLLALSHLVYSYADELSGKTPAYVCWYQELLCYAPQCVSHLWLASDQKDVVILSSGEKLIWHSDAFHYPMLCLQRTCKNFLIRGSRECLPVVGAGGKEVKVAGIKYFPSELWVDYWQRHNLACYQEQSSPKVQYYLQTPQTSREKVSRSAGWKPEPLPDSSSSLGRSASTRIHLQGEFVWNISKRVKKKYVINT